MYLHCTDCALRYEVARADMLADDQRGASTL
jgi:hypothetical protein